MLAGLTEPYGTRPLLLLSHVLRAERVWLGRIRGTPEAGLPLWETDTPEACRERLDANTAAFAELSGLEADAPENVVTYTNTKGTPYRTPLNDILEHVFNHGTHHRGQIALLVREAGQTPLALDYIAFAREQGRNPQ